MIRSFKFLVQRMKNIKIDKPLQEPVHNFSMFFMPMKEFFITFDKR